MRVPVRKSRWKTIEATHGIPIIPIKSIKRKSIRTLFSFSIIKDYTEFF